MGVILAATDALNWFSGIAGADAAHLTGDLGPLRAPGRTLFLPYLGGERTPLNSATVRGAFIGLEHATDRAAATRAVLEGVAFALRDCRDALAATGTRIESLVAVGGGSRSDYWLQVIATALDHPLSIPEAGDFGAAFGAARLGMMAATGDTGLATPPRITRTVAPDAGLAAAFDDGHARYMRAAQAILELT
jgi:xylulokinase